MPQYLSPPPELQNEVVLETIRELGHGGEGYTDLVKSTKTDRLFAVKTCQPGYYRMSGTVPREVCIMRCQIREHARIIKFKGYLFEPSSSRTGDKLLLFYDYYPGGDLGRFCVGYTDERFLTHVFRQMAAALAFLHDGFRVGEGRGEEGWKRILHCDVKPVNIFLKTPLTRENPCPDVVLGDFGLATRDLEGQAGGTVAYLPPELWVKSKEADVWGLGASVYHMARGSPPIEDVPEGWRGGVGEWMLRAEARRPRNLPGMYSGWLNGLVKDCLQVERGRRIGSWDLAEELNCRCEELSRGVRLESASVFVLVLFSFWWLTGGDVEP